MCGGLGADETKAIGNHFKLGVPTMRNFALALVIATAPVVATADTSGQASTARAVPAYSTFCDWLPSWMRGACKSEVPNI